VAAPYCFSFLIDQPFARTFVCPHSHDLGLELLEARLLSGHVFHERGEFLLASLQLALSLHDLLIDRVKLQQLLKCARLLS
jgi:hypothetical protein